MILAATLILLRETSPTFEVFLLKRNPNIRFAGGALVFPGGKVDQADSSEEMFKHCDGIEHLSPEQMSLVIAVIREVFEESGVLFARREGTRKIGAEEQKHFQTNRIDLLQNRQTFLSFLQREHLRLDCGAIHRFAHWITPKFSPRQYNTHFFLASIPEEQHAEHDGSESIDSYWMTPQMALDQAKKGHQTIIFPTRMNLERLQLSKSTQEAIKHSQQKTIATIQPWVEDRPNGPTLCIPTDAGYPTTEEPLIHSFT